MKVQHLEFENDAAALKALEDVARNAAANGGTAHVSYSFGHGPAIIVLETPDDAESVQVPVTTAEADAATGESED